MIVYLGVAALVLAMGWWVKENSIYVTQNFGATRRDALNKASCFGVFFVLFFLSFARVGIGNDYWEYSLRYQLISQSRVTSTEAGFDLVVRIVQQIMQDGETYIPIFAIFSFLTAFFMVKALYDQSDWFVASLFLLLANGYYFSSFNSVRYYLAFAMALFSLKYVRTGKWLSFVITILVAALFHKTVLLVLVAYPIANMRWKKWYYGVIAGASALMVVGQNVIRKLIFLIYPFYEDSLYDDYDISYANIAKTLAITVFALIYYKSAIKDHERNSFYFHLNILSLVVYACCWFIPQSTRIGNYLSLGNLLLIPGVIKEIPSRKLRIFWSVSIFLAYGVFFFFYLKSCYEPYISLLPYMSWFFI